MQEKKTFYKIKALLSLLKKLYILYNIYANNQIEKHVTGAVTNPWIRIVLNYTLDLELAV